MGVSQNKHIVNGKEREKLFSEMAKCNFIKHKFSMSQKIDFTENIEYWQKGKKTNVECVLCRKV